MPRLLSTPTYSWFCDSFEDFPFGTFRNGPNSILEGGAEQCPTGPLGARIRLPTTAKLNNGVMVYDTSLRS